MKQKKFLPVTELHARADGLLEEIMYLNGALNAAEEVCGVKIDEIRAEYAPQIEFDRVAIAEKVGALLGLMKKEKAALFAEKDVIGLKHGSLLRTLDKKNIIFHGKKDDIIATLERLGAGYVEAVHVAKSFDRDIIKEWPDDKITQIGAERKLKEEFSYDLKKEKSC